MDNKTLFNQFLQDFLQVKNDRVILNITIFIDSSWALIYTSDEKIDTFMHYTHYSNG